MWAGSDRSWPDFGHNSGMSPVLGIILAQVGPESTKLLATLTELGPTSASIPSKSMDFEPDYHNPFALEGRSGVAPGSGRKSGARGSQGRTEMGAEVSGLHWI